MEDSKRVYNQSILSKNTLYFKEEEFSGVLVLPNNRPNIEEILSVVIFPELESIRLLSTEVGKSNEGQVLTGSKLVIKLNLKEKVTYITDQVTQSSQTVYFEKLKSFFVILPNEVDGKSICELIRLNKFIINPYVEHISTRLLDSRTIFECVLLYIGVKLF